MAESIQGSKLPSKEVVEDLCLRFVVNKPIEDTNSFERLLFLIEEAHWYYEDYILPTDQNMKSLTIKEFASMMFDVCPGLDQYKDNLPMILKRFQSFKHTIPVMGAILLNPSMDKVMLVKGWSKSAAWGFPRGKRTKGESDENCAIREVYEETGFNIREKLVHEDFIQVHAGLQRLKLYIIPNVDENTKFKPLSKKEIGALSWHNITELPRCREHSQMIYRNSKGQSHRFYMVHPFMEPLKRWIRTNRSLYFGEKIKKSIDSSSMSTATATSSSSSFSSSSDIALSHDSNAKSNLHENTPWIFRFKLDEIDRCLCITLK